MFKCDAVVAADRDIQAMPPRLCAHELPQLLDMLRELWAGGGFPELHPIKVWRIILWWWLGPWVMCLLCELNTFKRAMLSLLLWKWRAFFCSQNPRMQRIQWSIKKSIKKDSHYCFAVFNFWRLASRWDNCLFLYEWFRVELFIRMRCLLKRMLGKLKIQML